MANSGLRRRSRLEPADSPVPTFTFPGNRKQLVSAIKSLDAYSNSKVASEFSSSSEVGRKLSIAGYVVMALLVLSEFFTFLRVEEREHMVVDTSLGQQLNISMNVTFHALTCAEVHLDAMDVAGDYHPYMEQHIRKQRLNPDGSKIDHEPVLERANVYEDKASTPDCGSCYGAQRDDTECCNTCDELLRAYSRIGWSTTEVKSRAPQCEGREQRAQKGEGCNLYGWIEVNKVGGNFHVALGESTVRDGRFIHQFNPTDAPKFNVSHTIHSLAFGPRYPGMASPLDGMKKVCTGSTGLYQYFVKLVPTLYLHAPGVDPVRTIRYSFTHRFRPLKLDDRQLAQQLHDHHAHARAHSPTAQLPGVFWVYDLSAFMVQVTTHRPTFSHFLVRVCAIVGGVTTIVSAFAYIVGL